MPGRIYAGLTLSAATLMSFAALADPLEGYDGYGPHMMWGGGWLGWVFGPLMMILVIGGIIAAIVFLARSMGGHAHPAHGSLAHGPLFRSGPLDILKERFARGEIDKEEYEDRRRVLGE